MYGGLSYCKDATSNLTHSSSVLSLAATQQTDELGKESASRSEFRNFDILCSVGAAVCCSGAITGRSEVEKIGGLKTAISTRQVQIEGQFQINLQ
jgi:hypothetical protein